MKNSVLKKSSAFLCRVGEERIEYFVAFLLLLAKNGLYAFRYYPLLDDYIQFGVYPIFEHPLQDVFFGLETYRTRPIASFLDFSFWGQMWAFMGVAFFILTVLHLFCYIFTKKALINCGIRTGKLFMILFLLCPLSSEATYFISASTRIIAGLFLASLALYFFSRQRGRFDYIFYLLFGILSCGFYEQVIVYLLVFSAVLLFFQKRYHLVVFPVVTGILAAAYYVVNLNSKTMRGGLSGSLQETAASIFRQIGEIFGKVNWDLLKNGFVHGCKVLLAHPLFFVFLLLSVVLFYFMKCNSNGYAKKKAFLGIVLALTSFLPFFVLSEAWISLRVVYIAIIGAAFLFDGILKNKNLLCAVLCFMFLVIGVSEIDQYRQMYETDQTLLSPLSELVEDKKTYVFGAQNFFVRQSSYYHEHIASVFESSWALTGAIRQKKGNPRHHYLYPVVNQQNIDFQEEYDMVGIIDSAHVEKLTWQMQDDKIILFSEHGELYGIIENGYFEKTLQ